MMNRRWQILSLLFAVRVTMAFQFESIAALAPAIRDEYQIGLSDLGFLIGLYLSPGIGLAVPSGTLGQRFGDKRMVVCGLALMAIGGLLTAVPGSWTLLVLGRIVSGTGGILLNVLMSKMAMDWFKERDIATAMAIYVNAWPAGIALALLVLPAMHGSIGITGIFASVAVLAAGAMVALGLGYHSPPRAGNASPIAARIWPSGVPLAALISAGFIWAFYNGALMMVFSFGNLMVVERGWSEVSGGAATSIVLWLVVVSIPVSGYFSDRYRCHAAILFAGCAGSCLLLLAASRTDSVVLVFIVLGLVAGLPAGAIMSLPTRVLAPNERAVGMGLYYTIMYVNYVLAPWIAGHVAAVAGTSAAALDLGAAMMILTCVGMFLFRYLARAVDPRPARV